jgi:hypothetical protein
MGNGTLHTKTGKFVELGLAGGLFSTTCFNLASYELIDLVGMSGKFSPTVALYH